MKTLKKFTAIIMAVVLCAAAPFAIAAAPTDYMLCDTDGDKVITASDARKILRISARLEEALPLLQVDADNDFQITASDARLALRTSAKLATLAYGYNAEGQPNVLNTLCGDAYSLVMTFEDFLLTVYVSKDAFFIPAEPFFAENDPDGMMSSILGNIGLLFADDNIYLVFTDNAGFIAPAGTKCYMAFTEETMGDLGGSSDDMAEIRNLADMFRFSGTDAITYVGAADVDGSSYEKFTYSDADTSKDLYLGYNAQLSYISYTIGDETGLIPISYVGSDVSGACFSTDGLTEIDLSTLPI